MTNTATNLVTELAIDLALNIFSKDHHCKNLVGGRHHKNGAKDHHQKKEAKDLLEVEKEEVPKMENEVGRPRRVEDEEELQEVDKGVNQRVEKLQEVEDGRALVKNQGKMEINPHKGKINGRKERYIFFAWGRFSSIIIFSFDCVLPLGMQVCMFTYMCPHTIIGRSIWTSAIITLTFLGPCVSFGDFKILRRVQCLS